MQWNNQVGKQLYVLQGNEETFCFWLKILRKPGFAWHHQGNATKVTPVSCSVHIPKNRKKVFFTHHKCSEEWWRLIPSVNQQMLLHSTNWTLTTICLLVSIWLEWDFIRSSQTCKRRLWLRRPSVLSTNHKVSGLIPGSSSLHVEVPLGTILNPNGMPHVKCINTL